MSIIAGGSYIKHPNGTVERVTAPQERPCKCDPISLTDDQVVEDKLQFADEGDVYNDDELE